ncbi:MAG: CHAT domain-containing protein [Planctomycetota bacterium]
MARRERVLVTGLGIGLSAVLLIGVRQAQTPVSASESRSATAPAAAAPRAEPQAVSATANPAAEIQEFVRLLNRLRANDESVLPALREIADRLCASHDRCDGREILAFYAAMAPEDRARGLEEEVRCSEIVVRVRTRYQEGRLDEEWSAIRDEAIDELEAIAASSLHAADVYPGACAASQRARLQADQLLSDYSLDEIRRKELLDSAREDASNSLAALERCGMLTGRLEPMWILGHLHAVEGDSVEARRSFEECLALAQRVGRVDWQEKAYQGLVDLAREAGDVHETEMLLDEISRLETSGASWFLVREQATLLLQSDLARSALDLLLAHPPALSPERREWNLLLGSAFLRQGRLNEAREQYALATPLPFSRDVALGMASVDLRAGNAERVFDQLSKREFTDGLDPFDEILALQMRGEAALALGRGIEAVADLERALSLGDGLQSRLGLQRDLVGVATSVIGERVGLHTLALLAEGRGRLGQHLEAARAIESWQSRTLRHESGRDISTEDLQAWARTTDLGLLTWVVGANSSVVAHVAPDGSAESVRIAHGHKSMEAAIRRLGEAVLGSSSSSAERLAERVRGELLPPAVSSRLGAGRLLVLVHGPIERLPIEFILRDESILPIVLPGLPSRDPGPALPASELARWSLLGSPVDLDGRQLLAGAREELASIARMRAPADVGVVQAADSLPLETRIGSAFDRDSLIAALRGSRALHLATHLGHACGLSQGRLSDVGFVLSGGDALCAREIAEIRPRLPLAVLSACETAEGRFVNAEGLQGMARAFLESGTRNLVVTLWPVVDESARAFAEEFHRSLLAGARPSEAVGAARAHLRRAGFPAADWAAFRLLGRD